MQEGPLEKTIECYKSDIHFWHLLIEPIPYRYPNCRVSEAFLHTGSHLIGLRSANLELKTAADINFWHQVIETIPLIPIF